jgi:pyrimidine-nucleoside phosphorylase
MLEAKLADGSALAKFREMVGAQGGDTRVIDDPSLLPAARLQVDLSATQAGYLAKVDALAIARMAFELGAGREKKTDALDLAVGVIVHRKVADQVSEGDVLLTLHANDEAKLARAKSYFEESIAYSDTPVEPLPLFYDTFYGDAERAAVRG